MNIEQIKAMKDGPVKKFRLLKLVPRDKLDVAKTLDCRSITKMLETHVVSVKDPGDPGIDDLERSLEGWDPATCEEIEKL